MTQIKKLLLSSVAACAIATSANAGIYLGQTEMSIGSSSETGTTVGLTTKSNSDTGSLYTGFDLAYTQMGLDDYDGDSTMDLIEVNFKLGLNITSQISVYGIGSAAYQDTTTDAANDAGLSDSYGVGFGAGVELSISDSISIKAEQKSYSMEADYDNNTAWEYDMDTTTVALVLTF